MTDGTMTADVISMTTLQKKIEELESRLTDYVISRVFSIDLPSESATEGGHVMEITIPDGYKVLTTRPHMELSGDSASYITDRNINGTHILFYMHNPNAAKVVVYAEVLFVKE